MKDRFKFSSIAFKIAGIYSIFGFLWILLSDEVLMILVNDVALIHKLQTFKGWFYVLITAVLVFALINKYDRSVQKNKAKYKRLLENIADPIYLINSEGLLIDANEAAIRNLGYSREELLKLHLSDIEPDLNLEEWIKNVSEIELDRHLTLETRHKTKDGSIFPVEISGCFFDEGGQRLCLEVVRNITQRLQTLELLVQHEKMNSLGSMAAGIAHEINNPLSAILGACQNINNRLFKDTPQNLKIAQECSVDLEILRDYLNRREISRMISSIAEAGERASRIVTSMLNFSYAKSTRLHTCQITSILDETLNLLSADFNLIKEYDFKKIKIHKEYSESPMPVCCIRSAIQQVFLNIFKNATEAMREKDYEAGENPKLTIRARNSNGNVLIEVEDNGPGMDESMQKKIFEPFYTSKEVGKGTGLGLSISYFIITDQHRGTLEVSSAPGKGTRFTISLPKDMCECCQLS